MPAAERPGPVGASGHAELFGRAASPAEFFGMLFQASFKKKNFSRDFFFFFFFGDAVSG
jgi:hypothetical protein